MTNEEKFVNELIGYIFAFPYDDYMTMECLCRKLHKHGLIEKKDGEWITNFTDRKDEPTVSKMEQVDKDINVRSKTENSSEKPNNCEEPQTEDTCEGCIHDNDDDLIICLACVLGTDKKERSSE